MADQRSLVTVVGARKRVDVALPAGAPVGEYAGRLADLCGQDGHDVFPPAWSLTPAGGAPMALEDSLADAGVADGAVLYLIDVAGDPGGEPAIEDIEELVADQTAGLRSTEPPRGLIVIALSLAWLAATGYVLLRAHGGLTAAITMTLAALVLLGSSWGLQQRRSAVPPMLCLVMSLASAACMASAGGLLFAELSPALWWVGVIAGANLGTVMALATTPEIILFAVELQLLVASLLIPLFLPLKVNAAEAAAATVVAAAALLGGAKWIAASITAWAGRPPKSSAPMAQAVTAMLIRARRLLTVVIAGPVLALTIAQPVLALSGNWWAIALTVISGAALLVRAKQAGFRSETVAFGISGLTGVFSAVGAVAHRFGGTGGAAITLALCGFVVLAIGVLISLVQLPITESTTDVSLAGAAAAGRRSVAEVVGLLCNLAVAPLAMGVYGVYGELMAIGAGIIH
ncbi:EsaB/YukD family protein [Catenuloplanes japonicus]|uniref:EsaB/YukD family protein n=1 Tax=Catenuloplanes japonicus TaxID=33876 RepID=UPI00052717B2|nr:EsaB/YukD family protein [Catenuloplanes japonicus]